MDAKLAKAPDSVRVGFVSLGCPKNLVDSEVMMGRLAGEGFQLTARPDEADVLVVNTCSFIDSARQESVETILEMAEHKRNGACKRLVVAGCLVQRYAGELAAELPEVDAFIGLDELDRIVDAVRGQVQRESWRAGAVSLPEASRPEAARGADALPLLPSGRSRYLYDAATPRRLAGPAWSSYLKISEGCDNPCTFCAIPSFRGRYRSRPLDDIAREAGRLAAAGVRELNLIAQDSTFYGRDLGFDDGPARLLRTLDAVDGLRWIRLFYLYPNRVTPSLLEALAGCARVVKYVDIPLQSGSRSVLARMKRGGGRSELLGLLARMRSAVPGLAIRTTFIVGFPGETETEFQETLRFLHEAEFDHAGAFAYSHEEGTEAFALADDVPAEVKQERQERLLEAQEAISLRRNREKVGGVFDALCEGVHPETEHLLAGRLSTQAPDIDGSVLISDGQAVPGEFVSVRILEAHPFDLVAEIVGEGARAEGACPIPSR